jgi:hypothetical protein
VTLRVRGQTDYDDVDVLASEFLEALSAQLLWVRPREAPLRRLCPLRDAPVLAASAAVAAVLSQPALLAALLARLPPRDIGASALTCVAFAAAARRDDTWRAALQRHEAPALAAQACTGAATAPRCWRALALQLDATQRRTAVWQRLQAQGDARFFKRRTQGRHRRNQPESESDGSGSADGDGGDTDTKPALRIERLEDYLFFIDAHHAPPLAGDDAAALSPPAQWTRLLCAACTMPTHGADGEAGSGLHTATADNMLHAVIDAAAAAAMPQRADDDDEDDDDAALDRAAAASDPHGEYIRDAPAWWRSYDIHDARAIQVSLAVMRRTDGAVALLLSSAEQQAYYRGASEYDGDVPMHCWSWDAPVGEFARYRKGDNECSVQAALGLLYTFDDDIYRELNPWANACPAYGFTAAELRWEVSAHATSRGDFFWDDWDALSEDVAAMLCLLDWQEA